MITAQEGLLQQPLEQETALKDTENGSNEKPSVIVWVAGRKYLEV